MAQHERPVDAAIREAAEAGAFDNLGGQGKPLPNRTGEDDFLRRFAEAEDAGGSFLPRSLQLRKEAHDLPARVLTVRSEDKVRELVRDLNKRISAEIFVPTGQPPLAMRLLDVEEVVAAWTADRARLAAERTAQLPPAPEPPARRRWWRRG
ncbi:DnaJ family domain-containing protein [Nakamurella sp. A5-74]|uniref:DnaJ family domain-containing protein n=1 Tax=Nakamurella sp. A5-74 TaxID=3158264 RepID=A0AAU8DLM8_9ACTN